MLIPDPLDSNEARLLNTLQELLALPALQPAEALTAAANRLAKALGCDKIDAFLLQERTQTLRAVGTSDTPMGRRQRQLGLHILAIANGGSVVEAFQSGVSTCHAHLDRHASELRGLTVELGVRSIMNVPFDVDGVRRGVLSASSADAEFFSPADLLFLEAVAHWFGMLTHRAELAERARKSEAEQARRAAADEIITVMAHDLRNHLQPLLMRLQLLRLRILQGKPSEVAEIEGAIRSVERLAGLTSDLLDVRRLDAGLFTLRLAPVDIVRLAHDTAAHFDTPNAAVNVSGLDELLIVADPARVRQVLDNLVANAIKYSPAGKPVRVEISTDEHAGRKCALIDVVDEGPGIPHEVLPTLFERYTAAPNSPGLGLGLYVAERIARAHGGDLTVDSEVGRGSRFRLMLPLELTIGERSAE